MRPWGQPGETGPFGEYELGQKHQENQGHEDKVFSSKGHRGEQIMNDKTLLGLSKLLEKQAKAARSNVEAGEYDLDATVTLHVSGTLSVGEDTEATPSHKIPWKTVLALFLHSMGATREQAMDKLVYAMQTALTTDENAAELLQVMVDLDEAETLVTEGLEELPKEPRKGAVNVKELTCTEVRRRAA